MQASVVLMIVLVVVFALQCINDVYLKRPVEVWLGLTQAVFSSLYLWQLLTFQFLHFNLWHLAGNLIGLWFFGRFVENVLGRSRFLVAYFGSGLVGGLLQALLMLLFPLHFGAVVFGASAGVSGMFAIFASLESESQVRWNFILPVRAWTLLMIYLGIALFFTLVPSPREGVAHAAHLGGILAGLAWVKAGWHRDFVALPWEGVFARWRRWHPLEGRHRKRELVRAAKVRAESWKQNPAESPVELPAEEFISQQVDPILDKISARGIHSLTERERKILEAARKKMADR